MMDFGKKEVNLKLRKCLDYHKSEYHRRVKITRKNRSLNHKIFLELGLNYKKACLYVKTNYRLFIEHFLA
jgi:hypothetical protein